MEVRHLLLLFTLIFFGVNAARDCRNKTRKPMNVQPLIPVYKVKAPGSGHKVTLVGLFPIHQGDCKTLSKSKNYRGFQRMEAMIWALDKINHDPSLTKHIKIEALIYDTCSDPVQAIKAVNNAKKRVEKDAGSNFIIGVVGAAYSSVTIPLAMTTSSMEIPLVSYASTNKQLTKQDMFARTVWSDDYTAIAVGDLVKQFSLTSLKTIGTQGDDLSNMLDKASKKYLEKEEHIKVCDLIKFPFAELDWKNTCEKDRRDRKWEGFHEKADHILKSKVDAFVIHIKDSTKMQFFKSLYCKMKEKDYHRKHPIQLVATGTIGITDEKELSQLLNMTEEILDITDGKELSEIFAIPIQLTTIVQHSAEETTKVMNERLMKVINTDLTFHEKRTGDEKNPWIEKVWQDISKCKTISRCDYEMVIDKGDNQKLYIQNKRTKKREIFQLDSKLESVIDAVTLYAKALHNYYTKKHTSFDTDVNANSFKIKFNGREFFNDLIKTSTMSLTRPTSVVKLDSNGDTIPKYDIYQFRNNEMFEKVGKMEWKPSKKVCQIGTQHGTLTLDKTFTKLGNYLRKDMKMGTECQPRCNQNERKIVAVDLVDECCHICYALEPNEIYHDKKISECKPGNWPNEGHYFCNPVETESRHDAKTTSGTVAITISVIFLIFVGAYMILFILNREHPAVRKSGTYFMAFIFTGAFICLIFSILIFSIEFTVFSCFIIKIFSCLGLTFMFSAMLVKTRKIYNIFILTFQDDNFTASADYTICPTRIYDWINDKMNPKTQEIAKVISLLSVQVFIIFLWILYPSLAGTTQVKTIYPADRALDFCNVSSSQVYVIQMFNMLLMVMCCGYAYLARNVPSEYNESRFIGHGMFAVSLISFSQIIINESVVKHGIDRDSHPYDPEYMWALFSICLSFQAVAVIGIMYTNKVIIILQGEKE